VIVAHIMGIPLEESVLQFAPAGATAVTMIAIAGRGGLGRVLTRISRRPWSH
jgi:hypothetical protein